jgi:type IV pilus assembly protein PilV
MTLVEVLVTLVIISVGLLGVAALQLATVRNNYDSFVRTQAATLAGDILDRMRANRGKVTDYRINLADQPSRTASTPAAIDLLRWRNTLNEQLPRGLGAIAYDATNRIVTVTIQWQERTDSENVNDRVLSFQTSSQI